MKMMNAKVAAVVALVLAAGHAHGQQYRGQDGRLLDRNSRVGSDGRNTQVRDLRAQIQLNNAIVTGNAGAGRSFRGYVGYTAPNDFRTPGGYLGSTLSRDLTFNSASDSQFAFRRDSASGYRVGTGLRTSDALRYQMALSTGQAAPAFLAATPVVQRESAATNSGAVTSTSSALRSTSDFLATRSLRPTLVGYKQDADNNEWNALASPLLGVSWLRVGLPGELPSAEQPPAGTPAPGGLGDLDVGKPPKLMRQPLMPTGLESRAQGMYSLTERAQLEHAMRTAANAAPTAVDARVSDTGVPGRAVVHTQLLETMRSAYPDAGKSPAAGVDEKLDLTPPKPENTPQGALDRDLERIKRVLRGQSPAEPVKPKPGEGSEAAAPAPQVKPPQGGEGGSGTMSPELLRAMKSLGVKSIDTLTAGTGSKLDEEMYRKHMAAGQWLLAESSFFDAEDRFTRAVAANPGDPLAKVGRIHAQIGAGLYLSAYANLRELIAASPELIGATYDAKLLPTPRRTLVIADQLREDMKGGVGMAFEASVLLAYLGHAAGNPRMLEDGLAGMESHLDQNDKTDKALFDLFKQVWTGGPAPAPAAPTDQVPKDGRPDEEKK